MQRLPKTFILFCSLFGIGFCRPPSKIKILEPISQSGGYWDIIGPKYDTNWTLIYLKSDQAWVAPTNISWKPINTDGGADYNVFPDAEYEGRPILLIKGLTIPSHSQNILRIELKPIKTEKATGLNKPIEWSNIAFDNHYRISWWHGKKYPSQCEDLWLNVKINNNKQTILLEKSSCNSGVDDVQLIDIDQDGKLDLLVGRTAYPGSRVLQLFLSSIARKGKLFTEAAWVAFGGE